VNRLPVEKLLDSPDLGPAAMVEAWRHECECREWIRRGIDTPPKVLDLCLRVHDKRSTRAVFKLGVGLLDMLSGKVKFGAFPVADGSLHFVSSISHHAICGLYFPSLGEPIAPGRWHAYRPCPRCIKGCA